MTHEQAKISELSAEVERLKLQLVREREQGAQQLEQLADEQDRFVARLLEEQAKQMVKASQSSGTNEHWLELREQLESVTNELSRSQRALKHAQQKIENLRETNRKAEAELERISIDSLSARGDYSRLKAELDTAKLIFDSAFDALSVNPPRRSLNVKRPANSNSGTRPTKEANEQLQVANDIVPERKRA